MADHHITTSDALGLALNIILFLLGFILRAIIWHKGNQKTFPRYNLPRIALYKNLLGIVISTQICSVVYLIVVLATVPQVYIPGESNSSSSGQDPVGYETLVPAMLFNVGFGNFVVLILNAFFIIISFLSIVTAFRQAYLARQEWAPYIPNHTAILQRMQSPSDRVDMCVVSAWNGFWAAFVCRQIGRVGLMSCVDPLVEISTRDARNNIIAEGSQERLEFLRNDPTSIPRPNSSYDCVLSVHTDRMIERRTLQDAAFNEMARVLRMNGCFIVICSKSVMEAAVLRMGARGITDIRTYPYTMMFLPSVMIIGTKTVAVALPPASANVDMANFSRGPDNDRSHLLNSGDKMYSTADRNGGDYALVDSTPKNDRLGLKIMLTLPYLALIILLNFLTFYYWAAIDRPAEFNYRYRFSSSCVLGFILFSGLMLLGAWDIVTDYITEFPNASTNEVTKRYIKATTISFVGSVLFNVIFYLPTYIINVIGYSGHWKASSIASANTFVVIIFGVVPTYIVIKYRQHKQKQIADS